MINFNQVKFCKDFMCYRAIKYNNILIVCKELKFSISKIYKIENNKAIIKVTDLINICNWMKVKPQDYFYEESSN